MKILREIPPKQTSGTVVGVDTEFFGMDKNLMHLAITGVFASLQIALPDETVYVITDEKDIAPALKAIDKCMWVLMKGQFDLTHLRRYANIPDRELLIDIMYFDKILWGGYFEQFSFSLSDMVRRYFSVYLDKGIREQFVEDFQIEGEFTLTEEQIQYAAGDALWTLRVGMKQMELLPKDQYENIWQDIDLPATYAFMASKPFRLDREAWEMLARKNEELKEGGDSLLPFNPRSKDQVIKYWRENGYSIPDSQETTIEAWVEENPDASIIEHAKLALEVKKASTYATKYGMGFIEKYLFQENDYWVVKPDYFTIGAETGRTSCSSPPLQGMPSKNTLEFRKCFIARPGHKLVIADYVAQEPCIAAYISKDKAFIDVVNSGEDIYLLCGEAVFSDPEENKANRKKIKDGVLGAFYGLTAQGMARRWGMTEQEAEDFIRAIFRPFPKLKRYLDTISKRKDYVKTVVGRKIWLNYYSYQTANNARNGPIQGTAADIMKKALVEKRKGWRKEWDDYPDPNSWSLVECVHDEAGYDVLENYAEEVAKYVGQTMKDVANNMCPGVLFRVDVHIADNWAEAKGK